MPLFPRATGATIIPAPPPAHPHITLAPAPPAPRPDPAGWQDGQHPVLDGLRLAHHHHQHPAPLPPPPLTCPASRACRMGSTLSWIASTLRTTRGSPPLLSMPTHLLCIACLNPTSPTAPSCFCAQGRGGGGWGESESEAALRGGPSCMPAAAGHSAWQHHHCNNRSNFRGRETPQGLTDWELRRQGRTRSGQAGQGKGSTLRSARLMPSGGTALKTCASGAPTPR